jgi:3-oxoacyl-[acyl-carrier protein] reductase
MNEKRIALVTGATRLKGIGAATCLALAEAGHDLFFTYWTEYDRELNLEMGEDDPEILQRLIEDKGATCHKMEWDLSDAEEIPALLQYVEREIGYPDILVNNACYSTLDSYETITSESLDRHYAINVKATTLLASHFSRGYQKGKGGRVINMTSGQSLEAMHEELSYAITKGAIEHITKTLVPDLAKKGITINAVNPGPNDTGWMDKELKKALLPKFPMGRVGTPGDVAQLIRFLASPEAEWVTGQIIHAEGGFQRS